MVDAKEWEKKAEDAAAPRRGLPIVVKVAGLPIKPLADFEDFQGKLKHIDRVKLDKLKGSIIRNGFNAPIFIWKGHNYILDGHQRMIAIKELIKKDGMVLEGGGLPYVEIDAATEKQAKEMILSYNSQYGEMSPDALADLLAEIGTPVGDLQDFVSLPDINFEEVAYKIAGDQGYEIQKRDMKADEAFYIEQAHGGKKGGIWGTPKTIFKIGRFYTYIDFEIAERIGAMLKTKGIKWAITVLAGLEEAFPDEGTRTAYLARVGNLFIEPERDKTLTSEGVKEPVPIEADPLPAYTPAAQAHAAQKFATKIVARVAERAERSKTLLDMAVGAGLVKAKVVKAKAKPAEVEPQEPGIDDLSEDDFNAAPATGTTEDID